MMRKHHVAVLAAALYVLICVPRAACAQIRFQGLGPTPAGPINIQRPPKLSQDGQSVIANIYDGNQHRVFRWREESGWWELKVQEFTPYRFTVGAGVSANGRFIAGCFFNSSARAQAVVWDEHLQARILPMPSGTVGSYATSVSDDGLVIWGASVMADGQTMRLTRWASNEHPELLDSVYAGSPPLIDCGMIFGATPGCGILSDRAGSVAFATSVFPIAEPFVRTSISIPLGDVPGGSRRGSVRGVSTDGHVAVGDTSGAEGWVAFRWTAETGMRWLGPSEIGITNATFAYGTSDDGQVIVGYSETGWNSRASVWSPESGWSNLKRVLMERYHQSEPEGWWMWFASGVSADGSVIIGTGHNPCDQPDIWMARLLPALPACVADFNQDGFADFFDLASFTDTFERAGPRADLNADCFVDFFDFSEFIESFDQGC